MKKVLNFRILLFICPFVAAGIIVASFFKNETSLFSFWIIIAILSVISVLMLVFSKKAVKLKRFTYAVIFTVLFVLSFLNAYIVRTSYDSNLGYYDNRVVCRIEEVVEFEYDYNIVAASVVVNGEKLSSKMSININKNIYVDLVAGQQIGFDAKVFTVPLINGSGLNSNYYRDNIKLYSNIKATDVTLGNFKPSVDKTIRGSVKALLDRYMGGEEGSVLYAMMFGDTSNISFETKNLFRLSGLAHLFAVSGLHIGLIFAFVSLILKKLKVRGWLFVLINWVAVFFYSYLCGFSPSSVRAALMISFYLGANMLGKKYDGISSMSLAFLILLAIKPFYLFDIGFQLSFLAVFSIAVFNPLIYRLFKSKLSFVPNKLAKSISVTLSVLIGTSVLTAYYFKYVPIFAFLFNLIALPLMSLNFILSIVLVVLSFVFNANLLMLPEFIIKTFVQALKKISEVVPLSLTLELNVILVVFLLLAIFTYSEIILIKSRRKAQVCVAMSLLCVVVMIFSQPSPNSYVETTNIFRAENLIIKQGDTAAIFLANGYYNFDDEELVLYLKENKIDKVIAIYLTQHQITRSIYTFSEVENFSSAAVLSGSTKVYIDEVNYLLEKEKPITVYNANFEVFSFKGLSFVSVYDEKNFLYCDIKYNGLKIAMLNDNKIDKELFNEYDLVYLTKNAEAIKAGKISISKEPLNSELEIFSLFREGRLIFSEKNGILLRNNG